MRTPKGKFESEVHLGLLVIIFILILLMVATNYVVFHTRLALREHTTARLNSVAMAITRVVQKDYLSGLPADMAAQLKERHGLSSIVLIPSRPHDNSVESRRAWFASIAARLGPAQIPEMAEKILASEFLALTRGRNSEYFYAYPVPSPTDKKLLILSTGEPVLAYLDDSSRNLFAVDLLASLMVLGVYLLLFRRIVTPFRKIRKEALDAGRLGDDSPDEIEAVVEDYRRIIDELKAKETQLLNLNEAIRRRAESLEEYNQYLLSSMDSGVVTLDNDGKVRSLNQAAARILGWSYPGNTGIDYGELFRPNGALVDTIRQCLADGSGGAYREYDFVTTAGERVCLGTTVSMISGDQRRQMGASVLINDLTAIRKLRAELETKNRLVALGEMAGGLAHQLRNSMGAILGYGRLIRKRLGADAADLGAVSALEEETRQAEDLVKRFLSFARPLKPSPEPLLLGDLVADLIASFTARSPEHRIDFAVQGSTAAMISADPLLIKQALSNILDNAVNAYEDKAGRVQITLSETPEFQVIAVRDWGCGIPDGDQGRIFTPFFSSRPSGSGLGLPLAAKIVDLHRGRITVTSEPGEGTEFVVSLPRHSDRPPVRESRQSARAR